MTPEGMHDRFTYRPPSKGGADRHDRLSKRFVELAEEIDAICPEGREKSLAFTKLEESKFWSSAAVARNESTR